MSFITTNFTFINVFGWKKGKSFRANMRGKFRNLNVIKSMIDARSNGKLGEYLVRAYYTAAKIKLKKDELQGPYVKIASGSF